MNVRDPKRHTRDLIRNLSHEGPMPHASGRGLATIAHRPDVWVLIALSVCDETIADARFVASNHPMLKACASLLTELVMMRTSLKRVFRLRPHHLIRQMYVYEEQRVFVYMVFRALHQALRDALHRTGNRAGYGWR